MKTTKARFAKTTKGYALIFDELAEGIDTAREYEIVLAGDTIIAVPVMKKEDGKFPERFIALAKKISSINPANRTKERIRRFLEKEELAILEEMERLGHVRNYKGEKFKESIISLSKELYLITRGEKSKQPQKSEAQQEQKKQVNNNPLIRILESRGYVVIENKEEAAEVSRQLEKQLSEQRIVGIRDFDMKYYVMMSEFYERVKKEVYRALDESECTIDEMTTRTKLDPDAVKAIVVMMREQEGDVIEIGRGIYKRV